MFTVRERQLHMSDGVQSVPTLVPAYARMDAELKPVWMNWNKKKEQLELRGK